MGIDYHAVCRETKESIRLGRLYEWGGGDRREWQGDPLEVLQQVTVGYGYLLRLLDFMYDRQGKLIEILSDDALFDLRRQHGDWKDLEEAGV
jgi:hypothetical protein